MKEFHKFVVYDLSYIYADDVALCAPPLNIFNGFSDIKESL